MFEVLFGYSSPMLSNYKVNKTGATSFELRDASSNLVANFTEVEQFSLTPFPSPNFSFFGMKIANSQGGTNTVLLLIENSDPTPAAIAGVYHPSRRWQGVWASVPPDSSGTVASDLTYTLKVSASHVFNNQRKLIRDSNVITLTENDGTPVATLDGSFQSFKRVRFFLGTVTEGGFTYPALVLFDEFERKIVGLINTAEKGPPNMGVFGGESDGGAGGGGAH